MPLKRLVVATLALAILTAACGAAQGQEGLPPFAYNSRESLEAYRFAVANTDLISQMPCYCGCARLSGGQDAHKSLKNCYLKDDGTFDDHAASCDLCNKIALDVKAWQKEGFSVKDIRARVDDKYQDYGQPTDTPPVE